MSAQKTLTVLKQGAKCIVLKRGQGLWQRGDDPSFFGCIDDGVVEIARTNGAGSESIVAVFGPGDVIGTSAVIGKFGFPADARASTGGAKVWKVPARSLITTGGDVHPPLQKWAERVQLEHEQILRDKISILSAGRVEDRILGFLEHLVRRFGRSDGDTASIPFPVSKTLIAQYVGIRVETAIRLLKAWEREGVFVSTARSLTLPKRSRTLDLSL